MPAESPCPRCWDRDEPDPACWQCGGTGDFTLSACPLACLTPDVDETLEMVDYAEAGHLPLAGGVHDQPAVFMHALRFVRTERAVIDRQLAESKRRRLEQMRGGR